MATQAAELRTSAAFLRNRPHGFGESAARIGKIRRANLENRPRGFDIISANLYSN
jgi:hypothetical protein